MENAHAPDTIQAPADRNDSSHETAHRGNSQRRLNKKFIFSVFALLLLIGLPLVIGSTMHQSILENHASGITPTYSLPPTLPTPAMINLNSTTDMLKTVNPDGTMGPTSSSGNWSNSLPDFLKGKLVFAVTDPMPTGAGDQGEGNDPTHSVQPTHLLPTQAQGKAHEGNNANEPMPSSAMHSTRNGPQQVSSLMLTIAKVEVHIAYLGAPGNQTATPAAEGKPSTTPGSQNQPVDHWETLNLKTPVTVDLVELAKTHDFSSLGLTSLAAGRYTEVRLYIKSASALFPNDETTIPLQLHGKDNIVKIVESFTIVAGQTTKLTMDFDASHSVIGVNGTYFLKPVVARLIEEH